MKKVFLSYHPESSENFVNALSSQLHDQLRITPLIINLQLAYKDQIRERIMEGTAACQKVLALLNDEYLSSKWHQLELDAFREAQIRSGRRGWVLPLKIGPCTVPNIFGREPINFAVRGKPKLAAAFRLLKDELDCTPRAFVAMSYTNAAVMNMYMHAREVFRRKKIECVLMDERVHGREVPAETLSELASSDIVMVDLTDNRPNCYYEAGFARALEKETILTARLGTTVHFNMATVKRIEWNPERMDHFEDLLSRHIDAIWEKKRAGEQAAREAQETGRPARLLSDIVPEEPEGKLPLEAKALPPAAPDQGVRRTLDDGAPDQAPPVPPEFHPPPPRKPEIPAADEGGKPISLEGQEKPKADDAPGDPPKGPDNTVTP